MKNKNLKVKVIGIGCGAQHSVDYLYANNKLDNIEFIVMGSKEPFLKLAKTENKYVISGDYFNDDGESLGCGGDPEVGEKYALRHIDKIREIIGTPDVVFLISSFGGGCGTGATPVIAEMLNKAKIRSFAIVTKPFRWEGELRAQRTFEGVEKLKQHVEKYIVFDNQVLYEIFPSNTTLKESWNYVNEKVAEEFQKMLSDVMGK